MNRLRHVIHRQVEGPDGLHIAINGNFRQRSAGYRHSRHAIEAAELGFQEALHPLTGFFYGSLPTYPKDDQRGVRGMVTGHDRELGVRGKGGPEPA